MGATLSKQEELFVACEWSALFELAAQQQHHIGEEGDFRRRQGFVMTPTEWQAINCLAEKATPSEAPSTLLSARDHVPGWRMDKVITSPTIATLSHLAAVAEGAIAVGEGLERLMALREHCIDDPNMLSHDPVVAIVQNMTQSVFLRQYGNVQRIVSPRTEKGRAPTGPSVVPAPTIALGPTEVLVVIEDALRLSKALHMAVTNEKSFENRPVYAFATSVVIALTLNGSVNAALRQLVANDSIRADASRYISAITAALCSALGELQQLDLAMIKAGYKALVRDPTHSIGGDFAIIRRLEQSIQQKLMVVDLARMRDTAVLQPPPSRPQSWADLSKTYVGQKAVQKVITKHFTAKARGVIDDNKPTVLLFFGPSGHGKSELAKAIAKVLHPEANDVEGSGKLVMIHLPSFCTKDSIYSLVDPPAAHVGEGMLLSALRKEPSAVVVLDEFEKSTADSIQNLWLSVFQKDGMLRSLKDSSRSTSTTKATFILTCNICDHVITGNEQAYLAASPAGQEAMREEFIRQCRDVVRLQLGEPFLNRVDFFLPFVPYSVEEKKDFAALQLSQIALQQYRKYQRLFIATPSYLATIATNTRNFHTSAIGQYAQEVLMQFPEPQRDPTGKVTNVHAMTRVAHSWARVESTNYSTALLYHNAYLGTSRVGSLGWEELREQLAQTLAISGNAGVVDALMEGAMQRQIEAFSDSLQSSTPSLPISLSNSTSTRQSPTEIPKPASPSPSEKPAPAGEAIPNGSQVVHPSPPASKSEPPQREETSAFADPMGMTNRPAESTLRRRGNVRNEEKEMLLQTQKEMSQEVTLATATLTERDTMTHTSRDLETQKEVERLKALVLEKDKEIMSLKETVKQLNTVVAVLLMFVLASVCLLALVVGMKVALVMMLLCGTALYLLVDNLFKLLWLAVKALYNFLGPVKFGALVAAVASYIFYVAFQAPPPCTNV